MDLMALGGGPASKGAKSAPAPSGGSMAKADPGRHKPLGQVLKEMELVSEGQIQEALQIQRKQGGVIGEILVNLAAQMGMEVVDLDEIEIDPVVINKVPTNLAKSYNVVPIKFENGILTVAMSNPHDVNVLDDLRHNLHCEVQGAVASEEGVA